MALSANTKELREGARKALSDIATGKGAPGYSAPNLETRMQAAAILLQDITHEEALS